MRLLGGARRGNEYWNVLSVRVGSLQRNPPTPGPACQRVLLISLLLEDILSKSQWVATQDEEKMEYATCVMFLALFIRQKLLPEINLLASRSPVNTSVLLFVTHSWREREGETERERGLF